MDTRFVAAAFAIAVFAWVVDWVRTRALLQETEKMIVDLVTGKVIAEAELELGHPISDEMRSYARERVAAALSIT